MAQAGPQGAQKSLRAAATLSAYRVVAPDTALSVGFVRLIQIPTETSFILGIAQQSGTTAQAVPVISYGYSKVAAGASVSAGALLTFVTATGYLIEQANATIGTSAASTAGVLQPKLVGVALQNGANTDAVIEAFISISNFRLRVA